MSANCLANVRLDFDGDRKTDIAIGSSRNIAPNIEQYSWEILGSSSGYSLAYWGASDNNTGGFGDERLPADYDGDGKTDYAVFRIPQAFPTQPNGLQCYFYILYSSSNTFSIVPWGRSLNSAFQDGPIPADYDGDGKTDIAIARSEGGSINWWILQSRDGLRVEQWGGSTPTGGDLPAPADYDGDGKADLAVARSQATGDTTFNWFIRRSSDGNWMTARLGASAFDQLAVGDYDGDGKADIGVVGRSTYNWRWISSSNGQLISVHWGQHLDLFARGDYDGDGKMDQAIYRPNFNCEGLGEFWINGSSSGTKVASFGGCRSNVISLAGESPDEKNLEAAIRK